MLAHFLTSFSTLRRSPSSFLPPTILRRARFASTRPVLNPRPTKLTTKAAAKPVKLVTTSGTTQPARQSATPLHSSKPALAAGRVPASPRLNSPTAQLPPLVKLSPANPVRLPAAARPTAAAPIPRALATKLGKGVVAPGRHPKRLVLNEDTLIALGGEAHTATDLFRLASRAVDSPPQPLGAKHLGDPKGTFSAHNVGLGTNRKVLLSISGHNRLQPRALSPVASSPRPHLQAHARASQTDAAHAPPMTVEEWYAGASWKAREGFEFDQAGSQHRHALLERSADVKRLPAEEAADPAGAAYNAWGQARKGGPGTWDGQIRGVLVNPKGNEVTEPTVELCRRVYESLDERRRGTLHPARDYDVGDNNVERGLRRWFRMTHKRLGRWQTYVGAYARLIFLGRGPRYPRASRHQRA